MADGCLTEQRALYVLSPLVGTLAGVPNKEPLLPSADLITRDRSHRLRSVDRQFWRKLPTDFQVFLDSLLTGNRSLATLLQP